MRYIYLLRAGASKYKVGIAEQVSRRVRALQTGNPDRIEVVCARFVHDAEKLERSLHRYLADTTSGGGTEWFTLTADQAIEVAIMINRAPELEALDRLVGLRDELISSRNVSLGLANDMREILTSFEHFDSTPVQTTITADRIEQQALGVFKRHGRASTSLLQRELRVGYARAARIMDRLQKTGKVSAPNGKHLREIL